MMKTIDDLKSSKEMLRQKRVTFYDHWKDLSEQVLPRHARFFREDRMRGGTKRNDKILNDTPTKAARVCASGMAAGISSPVRIWFRTGVDNPELAKIARVQEYLHQVDMRMRVVTIVSNLYNGLGNLYLDLCVYGTGAMLIDEDEDSVIRVYSLAIGSYFIEVNDRQQVDTIYRELSMTVRQLVTKFGMENCSLHVQQLAKEKKWWTWIDVTHVIEPNMEMVDGNIDHSGMEFSSYWFEDKSGRWPGRSRA